MHKKLACLMLVTVLTSIPTHVLATVNAASSNATSSYNQNALIVGIIASFITAIGALIVSLVNRHGNLSVSKRNNYANTVTSERVKWLDKLRNNISEFCGLTHYWTRAAIDDKKKNNVLERIDKLRYLIPLQLNRNDAPDKRILELIKNIPDLTGSTKRGELDAAIEELIKASQDLLKAEWEKVKDESKSGG